MTSQQINTLSQYRKYRRLLLNGACIAGRLSENSHVLLFQLNGQYVEVYLNRNEDRVLYSRRFEDTEELRPYLDTMNE